MLYLSKALVLPGRKWRMRLLSRSSVPPRKVPRLWLKVKVKSCPTLWDPMDCSLPGSSIHGIFQARILERVAISFSRGSSRPRDRTWASCIAGRHLTMWATREVVVRVRILTPWWCESDVRTVEPAEFRFWIWIFSEAGKTGSSPLSWSALWSQGRKPAHFQPSRTQTATVLFTLLQDPVSYTGGSALYYRLCFVHCRWTSVFWAHVMEARLSCNVWEEKGRKPISPYDGL